MTEQVPKPLAEALKVVFRAQADKPAAQAELRCVQPPIGCGKPITVFRDAVSAREYRLSGLCQSCQDETWAMFKDMEDEV